MRLFNHAHRHCAPGSNKAALCCVASHQCDESFEWLRPQPSLLHQEHHTAPQTRKFAASHTRNNNSMRQHNHLALLVLDSVLEAAVAGALSTVAAPAPALWLLLPAPAPPETSEALLPSASFMSSATGMRGCSLPPWGLISSLFG